MAQEGNVTVAAVLSLQYRCRRCQSLFVREKAWSGWETSIERELNRFAESGGVQSRTMPAMQVHSSGCSFNGQGLGDLVGWVRTPADQA